MPISKIVEAVLVKLACVISSISAEVFALKQVAKFFWELLGPPSHTPESWLLAPASLREARGVEELRSRTVAVVLVGSQLYRPSPSR